MKHINQVTICGTVANAPKVGAFKNGGQYANLTVLIINTYKDPVTKQEKATNEYVKVVVFDPKLVDVIIDTVNEGTPVFVMGELKTSKFQSKEGEKTVTQVVVKAFGGQFIVLAAQSASGQKSNFQGTSNFDSLNDDIPF